MADSNRPILINVAEAAQILSLSKWKVYELADSGALTKRYIGNRNYRLERAEVEAYASNLPSEPKTA